MTDEGTSGSAGAARIPADRSADVGDRQIEGDGTTEASWWADTALHRIPSVSLEQLLPATRRLVIVAPHPDDEVLGCGGLLSMALTRATPPFMGAPRSAPAPLLIAVTDGEASHPGSVRWTREALVRQRACERARGLAALGSGLALRLLRIGDGQVAESEPVLQRRLSSLLLPGDVVITTWRKDGHPDHEACGRVCAELAGRIGFDLLEMPVWMWHWARPADARVPWDTMVQLPLSEQACERKRGALQAHRSQIEPDDDRPPVLPASAMERLRRPTEFFFQERPA